MTQPASTTASTPVAATTTESAARRNATHGQTGASTGTGKTLTFVVPAYNMEDYLERCVLSLTAARRNNDIEVLIVDDGSKIPRWRWRARSSAASPTSCAPSIRRTRVTAAR